MEEQVYTAYIQRFMGMLHKLTLWLIEGEVLWWTVGQIVFTAFALLLAYVMASKSAKWFKLKFKKTQVYLGFIQFHTSATEGFFLLFGVILLWCGSQIATGIGIPHRILDVLVSLAAAWAVIRFTSSTIKTQFWARTVAVMLWTLAALNIMGWLGQTIDIMDKAAIQAGDFRLSVLLIIKSLLAFGVLFLERQLPVQYHGTVFLPRERAHTITARAVF